MSDGQTWDAPVLVPCKDAPMGSYLNQVSVRPPTFVRLTDVGIDHCIVSEVVGLWARGIRTTGCCCGHGKLRGMINVADEHAAEMANLGYEVWRYPDTWYTQTGCVPEASP